MDNRSHSSTKITPQNRAEQFPPAAFRADDEQNLLFCATCNVPIDHRRKDACTKHLLSTVHQRKVVDIQSSEDSRIVIESAVQNSMEDRNPCEQFRAAQLMRLVGEFCGANIPLNVLDIPSLKSYLETNLQNVGIIPSSHQLRQSYLPKVFDVHRASIKEKLHGAISLAIVCDETTDSLDRYVLNVLAVRNLSWHPQSQYKLESLLLRSVVLESTNYKTVSESVLNELFSYEIPFSRISAFVTDNAAYMHKAWKDSLKGVLLNAVHVTCTAHLLNLVCEIWQSEFTLVNKLVASVKKGFTACPSRKARFRQFLVSQGKREALPPEPVTTRWNTWFAAALYHADHLEDYAVFFAEEAKTSSSLTPQKIVDLSVSPQIKTDIECLKNFAPSLMQSLTRYESADVRAHVVVKDMELISEQMLVSLGVETNPSATRALQKSREKLHRYMSEEASLTNRFYQPASNFFRACQVFDVQYAKLVSVDQEHVFRYIPWFEEGQPAKAELSIYLTNVGGWTIPKHPIDFWFTAMPRFPRLSTIAITCLSVPVTSVAAERSFSLYSQVLRDNRQRISNENLNVYNMLYQNPLF